MIYLLTRAVKSVCRVEMSVVMLVTRSKPRRAKESLELIGIEHILAVCDRLIEVYVMIPGRACRHLIKAVTIEYLICLYALIAVRKFSLAPILELRIEPV